MTAWGGKPLSTIRALIDGYAPGADIRLAASEPPLATRSGLQKVC